MFPLLDCIAVANIKSQIKRNRQNERARARNKAVRTSLKTDVKKAHVAATSGNAEIADFQVRTASRAIDKAASKGMIHKRTAARRKSRLAKAVARSASA